MKNNKIKSSIDLVIGLIVMFGYLWIIYPCYHDWLKIVVAFFIFIFLLYCKIKHKESFKDIGFAISDWRYPVKINCILIIIVLPIFSLIWIFFFSLNESFLNGPCSFSRIFLLYPLGALCQQYLFFGFFFRRYKDVFENNQTWTILSTALTFSIVHYPNPSLLLLTFIAGLVWGKIYFVQPNLYVNAISHSFLGIFTIYVLGVYGEVGPMATPWQWSKSQEIKGSITSVNSIIPQKRENRVIKVGKQVNAIIVRGNIEKSFKIKDANLVFNNTSYLLGKNSLKGDTFNFTKKIPIDNILPGNYKLIMKVSVVEKYVNNYTCYPGKEIIIKKLSKDYFTQQTPVCLFLPLINREGKNKLIVSNIDPDLIETEYGIRTIELYNVFNSSVPHYFQCSLEYLRKLDKGYEVFIIIRETDDSLKTIFKSDSFKKFIVQLGQSNGKYGEVFFLYHYQP